VLKFGFLAGALVGALIATLLQQPKAEDRLAALGPEPDDFLGKVKHRIRAAQIAANDERKAKEAEVYQDYEGTLRKEESEVAAKGAEVKQKT
jgi:hypothetical protein